MQLDALIEDLRKYQRGETDFVPAQHLIDALAALKAQEPVAQTCVACGKPWDGEKCGQAANGWPFQTCTPSTPPPPAPDEARKAATRWRELPAPTLERVFVAGIQPRSGSTIAYWWVHEDVTDEKGMPDEHKDALLWCALPDRPAEDPETVLRARSARP